METEGRPTPSQTTMKNLLNVCQQVMQYLHWHCLNFESMSAVCTLVYYTRVHFVFQDFTV